MELRELFEITAKRNPHILPFSVRSQNMGGTDPFVHLKLYPKDINDIRISNMSLLHWAAIHNCREAIPFLIRKGFRDLDTVVGGRTALLAALTNRSFSFAAALLEHPVDVNCKDMYDRTAIHCVADSLETTTRPNARDIIQMLVERGCDINGGGSRLRPPIITIIVNNSKTRNNRGILNSLLNEWGGYPSLSTTVRVDGIYMSPIEFVLRLSRCRHDFNLLLEAHATRRIPIPNLERTIKKTTFRFGFKLKALHSLECEPEACRERSCWCSCSEDKRKKLQELRYRYFFSHSLVYILLRE